MNQQGRAAMPVIKVCPMYQTEEDERRWDAYFGASAYVVRFSLTRLTEGCPDRLLNLPYLAAMHGVVRATWQKVVRTGALPVVRGNWQGYPSRMRRGPFHVALDYAGVERFHALWPDAAKDPACPYCLARWEVSEGRPDHNFWW